MPVRFRDLHKIAAATGCFSPCLLSPSFGAKYGHASSDVEGNDNFTNVKSTSGIRLQKNM